MPSKLHLLGILPFMGKSLLFPIYGSQKGLPKPAVLLYLILPVKSLGLSSGSKNVLDLVSNHVLNSLTSGL